MEYNNLIKSRGQWVKLWSIIGATLGLFWCFVCPGLLFIEEEQHGQSHEGRETEENGNNLCIEGSRPTWRYAASRHRQSPTRRETGKTNLNRGTTEVAPGSYLALGKTSLHKLFDHCDKPCYVQELWENTEMHTNISPGLCPSQHYWGAPERCTRHRVTPSQNYQDRCRYINSESW